MTTLASFYALAAAAPQQYRRYAVGAAYSLYERAQWGESIAGARSRIMSLPQYSTALVGAGLDDDFALVDTMPGGGGGPVAAKMPWAPPGYPSYTGYTVLSINDANKSSLSSLTAGVDYKITLTGVITGALGAAALTIIGGRNVVIIGGEINHAAVQGTTTISAIDATQTTVTFASNTLSDSTALANGMRLVIDPGSSTASEAITLGTLVSGTTWNVTRNTGYAGSTGVAVAHSAGAVAKRSPNGPSWGIACHNWTGILHLEGLYVHGSSLSQGIYQQNPNTTGIGAQDAIIQVQNCHMDAHADDVRNGNDNHGDGWQVAGGVAEQRVAYCSFRSTSNGLQWQPHDQDANYGIRPRLWDLRNVDVAGSTFFFGSPGYADTSRHLWYTNQWALGTGGSTSTGYGAQRGWEVHTENLYMQPAAGRTGSFVRWASTDNHEILLNKVIQGTPAAGPYCPTSAAGTGYSSPGYDTTVSVPLLGRERGQMAADSIRGLTKRTLGSSGSIGELRAFVQMANYRRAVLEATPGFYARLRETAGTSVAEEPMWAWGAATSANVTLNSVTSPIADAGPAYGFNGTSAYVSKAFDLSGTGGWKVNQLTLMAFVYVNNPTLAADQVIVEHTASGTANAGGFLWEIKPSGLGTHEIIGPENGFWWNDFAVPTAVGWHHFVVQIDRTAAPSATPGVGGVRMYLDGVAQTPNSTGGVAPGGFFANSTMYLMSRAGTSLFTAGRMAEFAWFPRILPADEIAHIYNQSQRLSTNNVPLRMAAYKDPIATASSLIGLSNEVTVPGGTRGQWVAFPFATPPAITAGDFWTGVFAGANGADSFVARMAGGATDGGIKVALTYPTAPTAITPDSYDQFAYSTGAKL